MIEPLQSFEDDVWELYDTSTDWSQAHDLAAEMPEKLGELQQLWLAEAKKHNVLPLDDRRVERFDADLAGRPQLLRGRSQLLFGGMGRLTESSVLNVKNRSDSVTAEVEVPESGAEGVIVAQGGAFGGRVLYTLGGRLKYCHNFPGCGASPSKAREPFLQGHTSCGWSSPTTAVGPGRAGRSASTWTAP